MSPRDLSQRTLSGQSAPRTATGPLAVHFCAGVAGFMVRQYTTQARLLAESVLRYYERFKPDAVWVSADTWVSAQAMGARAGAAERFTAACIGVAMNRTRKPNVN